MWIHPCATRAQVACWWSAMAQFVSGAAKLVAGKRIENFARQFEPEVGWLF